MPPPESKAIAVLGGGITGLTAAYRLTSLGHRVRLFERSARVGGVIQSETKDGWLFEKGPNSMQEGAPEVSRLIQELGLETERLEVNPSAKNRYLARGSRLIPAPLSPLAFVSSPLISIGAKARVLAEIFARRRHRREDLSFADFVREHFGSEIMDSVVQPIVSGVYAGDPARLSAREAFPKLWGMEERHGSLLLGQIAAAKKRRRSGQPALKIISFKHGLQTLPESLAARLPPGSLALNATVKHLALEGRWQVAYQSGGQNERETFDAVISALPAPALASIVIGHHDEKPLAALAAIEHPPVSSLFLGYRREQIAHPLDGFGVLIPAVAHRWILGILFSSSLFPGRAPPGHVAVTVIVGGCLQPEIAREAPSELLATVRSDLSELLGVSGDPVFVRHQFWPSAIPQYELGHENHREAMAECERAHPGLFIGGQARDGISVPQCILSGLALAQRAIT